MISVTARAVEATSNGYRANARVPQVWQEQISPGIVGGSTDAVHTFIEASQAVLPPTERRP